MLDPSELLAFARDLAAKDRPRDAEIRRAISSAYYALFHATLKSAAERFVGVSESASAAYALLYRGFSHGRMKDVCLAINRPALARRYQQVLGQNAVSVAAREYAAAFHRLQERRHVADYDPQVVFHQADAADACALADLAMRALARIDSSESADLLALLLVDSRA